MIKNVALFFLGVSVLSDSAESFAAQLCDRVAYGNVESVGVGTKSGALTDNPNEGRIELSLIDLSREEKDDIQWLSLRLDPRKPNEKEMLDLAKMALLTDKVLAASVRVESDVPCNKGEQSLIPKVSRSAQAVSSMTIWRSKNSE